MLFQITGIFYHTFHDPKVFVIKYACAKLQYTAIPIKRPSRKSIDILVPSFTIDGGGGGLYIKKKLTPYHQNNSCLTFYALPFLGKYM